MVTRERFEQGMTFQQYLDQPWRQETVNEIRQLLKV
jgi:hypothetical protein